MAAGLQPAPHQTVAATDASHSRHHITSPARYTQQWEAVARAVGGAIIMSVRSISSQPAVTASHHAIHVHRPQPSIIAHCTADVENTEGSECINWHWGRRGRVGWPTLAMVVRGSGHPRKIIGFLSKSCILVRCRQENVPFNTGQKQHVAGATGGQRYSLGPHYF